MLQKALLVAFALVLLGLGIGTLLGGDDGPELSGPRPADAAGAATEAALVEGAPATGVRDADADAAAARAVAAVLAESTARPLPDDPRWVEVEVVDGATGAPMPGALVRWYDETVWDHYHRERGGLAAGADHELSWDCERLADLAGWRTRSDAHGVARVTLKQWTLVAARHEQHFGKLQLQGGGVTPIGGHVVELGPDATLLVRVVDDRGSPCADVPVTVSIHDQDRNQVGSQGWAPLAHSRAPDGIAAIAHVQDLADDLDGPWSEPGRSKFELRVRLCLPGVTEPGVVFDPAAPPAEAIELRLPPYGSVVVRAEHAGKPLPGFRTAWMAAAREQQEPPGMPQSWFGRHARTRVVAAVGRDGTARFPFVPLGQQYRFGSDVIGGVDVTQPGPLTAGQQVEVVLSPRDDAMLLAGTLLGPDRRPIADDAVHVRCSGPQVRSNAQVHTGGDGRFVVNLGSPRKDNRVDRLAFEQHGKDASPRCVEVAGRTLRAGLEELGELVLAEGTTIVAGRIVAGGEPFREPLSLRIERHEPSPGGRPARWRRLDGTLEHHDGDGGFGIRGTAPPARYRLVVQSDRVLPIAPIEFVPGTTDLVVAVDRGQGLAASVLLAARAPAEFVTAALVPTSAPRALAEQPRTGRLEQQLERSNRERHHVAWPAIPAGSYTLELRLWAVAEPLLVIPDVVLPPPPGGDPRLVDLDLRPVVRVVTLALCEADGRTAVDGQAVVFPTVQASASEWLGYHAWSQPARLLLPAGPFDVLVAVEGFRPQPLRGDHHSVTVRLDRWPTLVVRVPDMPALPATARVQVMLQPVQPRALKYRTPWSAGDASEYLAPPRRAVPVTDGTATVAIGDALHTVLLTVAANRRSHTIEGHEPQQVLPTVGEVVVTVPAAQWQRAIEAVSQPPPAAPARPQFEGHPLPGR